MDQIRKEWWADLPLFYSEEEMEEEVSEIQECDCSWCDEFGYDADLIAEFVGALYGN